MAAADGLLSSLGGAQIGAAARASLAAVGPRRRFRIDRSIFCVLPARDVAPLPSCSPLSLLSLGQSGAVGRRAPLNARKRDSRSGPAPRALDAGKCGATPAPSKIAKMRSKSGAEQVYVIFAWADPMLKFWKNLTGPCSAPTYLPTYPPYGKLKKKS